jgi:hypothetical protein
LQEFYKTWQKFIDLGVNQIYPSHGKQINISKIKQNIHKLTMDGMGKFFWA